MHGMMLLEVRVGLSRFGLGKRLVRVEKVLIGSNELL